MTPRRSQPADNLSRSGRPRRWFKQRILVVCDADQTEPNYFNGLKRHEAVHARFVVDVKKKPNCRPDELVDFARKLQVQAQEKGGAYDYDWVFLVFDAETRDYHGCLRQARDKALRKLGNKSSVIISNPCFEIWLLAHFERTARPFHNADEVIRTLTVPWQRAFEKPYTKTDKDVFTRLESQVETALRNAQSAREEDYQDIADILDCNSATEVYRLVGFLLGKEGFEVL